MRRTAPAYAALVAALSTLLLVVLVAPSRASTRQLPPTGTDWDYQLGGKRPVPDHVGIVERDRLASPAKRKYNICYVNGFQTQADQKKFWHRHWSLVLKDGGKPVEDSAWGEWLLDLRTHAKRAALAKIMGKWTQKCADDGFQAVEYDNLDSFSRSHHLLTKKDNRRYAGLLVAAAHDAGLAAAQKNWAEWDGSVKGYDFAIAEQCAQYSECASYVDSYGSHVLAVEYHDKPFHQACRHWADTFAIVRRDVNLTKHGVRRWC
ncbi:MAG TPA: endo alpha-1,4 polygalactosaminidase [Nocardioides sp.]|jgi:hypothetical protein|nr:endo alpha-1,4 polygalactosaminidase [Nocardioides sp.]